MEKNKIDKKIVKEYVKAMNSIREPMSEIKKQINVLYKYYYDDKNNIYINKFKKYIDKENEYKAIIKMIKELNKLYYINNHNYMYNIKINVIKQIMKENNGMFSTRILDPLNISREYLNKMQKDNEIIKISRGIYIHPNIFEDSYYSFQQKYKKAIFSHMNALYFYELTEEFPSNYTITVPLKYHVEKMSEKHAVFYVSEKIYDLGMIDVKTPSGNIVKAYDKERCICDIIRSKNRMDPEQVEKTIKLYINSKDKDMKKLYNYSEIMGIKDKVQEMVGGVY